jgi:hypothetical protein
MSRHLPRHTDSDLDLDPQVAAELERLEAALAGTPSADPDLLALVAAVRDEAVPPTLAFRKSLDERTAAGFPGGGGPRAWLAAVRGWAGAHRTLLVPALGATAAVLIALVVAVSALTSRDSEVTSLALKADAPAQESAAAPADSATSSGAAGTTAQDSASAPVDPEAARKAASTAAGTSAVPGVPPTATLPGTPQSLPTVPGRDRKVERSTQLALKTNARGLQRVADGVVRVTQTAGGVVEQSSVDATDRGGTADFTLTVPSAKSDLVVARLSKLAHVSSMSQASNDITAGFVNYEDQLSDARAERRALLKALDGAKTEEGIARLKGRIATNRGEIARLKGQLNGLRHRADNTTLSVTVTASGGAAPSADKGDANGGPWSPGDAAGDALRVLEIAAGVLLIALAVMVPLGLITVPALLGARVARRRRREQALDPA